MTLQFVSSSPVPFPQDLGRCGPWVYVLPDSFMGLPGPASFGILKALRWFDSSQAWDALDVTATLPYFETSSLTIDDANQLVYLNDRQMNAVIAVDCGHRRVRDTIVLATPLGMPGGQELDPWVLRINPITHWVYVCCSSFKVYIIDGSNRLAPMSLGLQYTTQSSPRSVGIELDGNVVVIGNSDGTVDVLGGTVSRNQPGAPDPRRAQGFQVGGASDACEVSTFGENGLIWVTLPESQEAVQLKVANPANPRVRKRIPVGRAPTIARPSPASGNVFVPCFQDGTVVVVRPDFTTATVALPDLTPPHRPTPFDVAFSPATGHAFTTGWNSQTIHVIDDTNDPQVVQTVAAFDSFPGRMYFEEARQLLYVVDEGVSGFGFVGFGGHVEVLSDS